MDTEAPTLAETFERIVDSLPDDWTDLELDLRIAKVLRFGRTKTLLGVDLYNALNSSAVLSYNQSLIAGGSWLIPTSVLSARFAKISAQFDF